MRLRAKILRSGLLLITLTALLAGSAGSALALDPGEGTRKKEIKVRLNRSFEVSIGNGGVYMDDSQHIGTLQVRTFEPVSRGWHQFTQRILDVRIFDSEGDLSDRPYGLIRVYFNFDSSQLSKWNEPSRNMSIWHFDPVFGGWSKCTTHFESPTADYPKGRVYCLVREWGLYGIAWTKPTLIMKLEKAESGG